MTLSVSRPEPRAFADVSAVTPGGPGRFHAEVDEEWTIGGKPNGGYLLAMMARAATWSGPHDHVVAASAHYVRAPEPGPVVVHTETLRTGRTASQIHVAMHQEGARRVEALVTAAHLDVGTTPYWDGGVPPMSMLGFEQCMRLNPVLPSGGRVALMEQIEVRLEPQTSGFVRGAPSGRGELRGWLALGDHGAFDPTSLLFALDAFPPATFDVEFSGWVPTLELTGYVRALPAPGPVRVLQRAQLVEAGRVDEACFIWDARGYLVAHGTQLAGIRLG